MTDQELRDLDAWICQHVFGSKYHHPTEEEMRSGSYYQFEPRYSTDPAASFEVLRRIAKEHQPKAVMVFFNGHEWAASLEYAVSPSLVHAETLELSICLLAKKLYAQRGEGE